MREEQSASVIVEDVHKSFGDVHALRGITFTAERGTVLGVLGPNGAGKTTTVKILSTLLRPTKGRAVVAGGDFRGDHVQCFILYRLGPASRRATFFEIR